MGTEAALYRVPWQADAATCESPVGYEPNCRRIHPAKYTVDGVWGGRLGYFALLAA